MTRHIQTSVTNFLYCGDDYLFLLRNKNKRIDPGRLNGIGGKVEVGENYLQAVIRETWEETGYHVIEKDITFNGIIRLEGGYDDDWVFCIFNIKVASKKIPIGEHTNDGTLMWLHKDQILQTNYELVDDIYYCIEDIISSEKIFFANLRLDRKQKVKSAQISYLKI